MSETRPWFKFWHQDFWSDDAVRVMSAEAVCLYMLLLTEQWRSDHPLRDDEKYWRRVHGGRFEDFAAAWAEVRPLFDSGPEGIWNPRMEEERQAASRAQEARSESARHAARMRWACAGDAKRRVEKKRVEEKRAEQRERKC